MTRGVKVNANYGVWRALEILQSEKKNPRLIALIERKDAEHLLAMRNTLKLLVTAGASKKLIATAKKQLAHK